MAKAEIDGVRLTFGVHRMLKIYPGLTVKELFECPTDQLKSVLQHGKKPVLD